MFDAETRNEIEEAARNLGIEPAALLAVVEVESGGRAFAMVGGRKEPLIRFEGHYFDRRLAGTALSKARKAGLADPKAGAVGNPPDQAARWTILARAAAIDHKAAHESVSWGVGQVMGAHWNWLGYASIDDLVAEARTSVAGQVALMTRYIDKAGLSEALQARDWAAFARGYNGPDYARHGYHTKIAAAYRRYSGASQTIQPRPAEAAGMLRRGDRGDAVFDLQTMLVAAGHGVARDGIFGPDTEAAVRRFQAEHGLDADGIAGPKTLAALAGRLDGASGSWWISLTGWMRNLWR